MPPTPATVEALSHPLMLILLVALFAAGFTTYLAFTRPSYPGWRSWSAAVLTLALGLVFGLLRTPETLLVSVFLGNALIAASSILAVGAYRRYAGLQVPLERLWVAAFPVLAGAFVWFTLFRDVIATRIVLINLYGSTAALMIVGLCVAQAWRQPRLRSAYLLGAVVFAVFLAASAPHAVTALAAPERLFVPSLITVLYHFSVLWLVVAGTFAMLVLHDDRRRQEVTDLHADLRRLLDTDALTGLANRRGLSAHYAVRASGPVSLAVLDIDHFKVLNDRFGHETGDVCLRHLARLMREVTREHDCAARYGGEEFVLTLRGTTLQQAVGVVRRVQEALSVGAADAELPAFTVSAGVVEGSGQEPLEALVRSADELLYEAKRRGRNMVCFGVVTAPGVPECPASVATPA